MNMKRLILIVVILVLGLTTIASAQDTTGNEPGGQDLDDFLEMTDVAITQDSSGFAPSGPGLHETALILHDRALPGGVDLAPKGSVRVWNTRDDLKVTIDTYDDWLIRNVALYVDSDPIPLDFLGIPVVWKFPFVSIYRRAPVDHHELSLNLSDDVGFKWGSAFEPMRVQNVAAFVTLVRLDENGQAIDQKSGWAAGLGSAYGDIPGFWFSYELAHPRRGHFVDSPVGGVYFQTDTHSGITDESGGFDYFPSERMHLWVGSVYLGEALAAQKVTPLGIFDESDIDDPRVINLARFLQSLDAGGTPTDAIDISEPVIGCLDAAMTELGLGGVDWADDGQVDAVLQTTHSICEGVEGVNLVNVPPDQAKANLDKTVSNIMFRKNIARTPSMTSTKSKLNIMGRWFPAKRADGSPATYQDEVGNVLEGVPYYDDEGNLVRAADSAKPVAICYTDAVETGEEDTFCAISRDDGNTWKRKNISRTADRSSFTLLNGQEYFGGVKKPVFQAKGNNVFVAWTSKYCKGGKPAYAINVCPDTDGDGNPDPCEICTGTDENETCEIDYTYDDPYYTDDIWGVAGPQLSVDYAEQDFPEVGEIPYSCVWSARGTLVTDSMLGSNGGSNFWSNSGYELGDIVWFKPERLTSGSRDALQIFAGGADGAGFGIAWQEDPAGLRPGSAAGPGHGWSGATTNHKTDIWYSYITMSNFAKVDTHFVAGGDPEHELDVLERPKAQVPMSLPVRVTDNDAVNTDSLMVLLEPEETGYPVVQDGTFIGLMDDEGKHAGKHRYGYEIDGLCDTSGANLTIVDGDGSTINPDARWYEFINEQEALKRVCITEDGRLLDGDTGASRPNLFMQTYKKSDGTKSAWAILAYEETKGVGGGAPDHEPGGGPYGDEYVVDEGKNFIYHSFDFQTPELVSAGNIANLPETDEAGELIYLVDELGEQVLDHLERPQVAYENARRPRFILQSKTAAGGGGNTVLLALYKEGQEGMGRPSDIMMRRIKAPDKGNPYSFKNMICSKWAQPAGSPAPAPICVNPTWDEVGGDYTQLTAYNMSSLTPTEFWENPDSTSEDSIKVIRWEQTEDNFFDDSSLNPYDDARAHRGQIRGDFVVMGYSYTPNWAASRNGNDKYDFYVRRSFDGGITWITSPGGTGVEHCDTWKLYDNFVAGDESGLPSETICTTYGPGEFEPSRNMSQLKNNKETVIEPRIVAVPGTIKDPATGEWTGIDEDKQNRNVFYLSYGTATNPPKPHGVDDGEEYEISVPADLYYTFSRDKGETFALDEWVVNGDPQGDDAPVTGETVTGWFRMAKGDPEQGEAQLRMTPDGSRFYSSWLQEGDEGSDIWFRRITPAEFPANQIPE